MGARPCVLAPGEADWAGAHRAVQPGVIVLVLFQPASSLLCCSRRPPAGSPPPSVCLLHSDHSHGFIELAREKTFVFPARASVKELEGRLTPPASLSLAPVISLLFLTSA